MEKRFSPDTLVMTGMVLVVLISIMTATMSGPIVSAAIKILCVTAFCIFCLALWRKVEDARRADNHVARAVFDIGDRVRYAGTLLVLSAWWILGELYDSLYRLTAPWIDACAEHALKYLEKHPKQQAMIDVLLLFLTFGALIVSFPFYLHRRLKMDDWERKQEDWDSYRHI